MELLNIWGKMETNVLFNLSMILFVIRESVAECPKGEMDEHTIPLENRVSYDYDMVCTNTDMYWQDTQNKLDLTLNWYGCEDNIKFCFVKASSPIKLSSTASGSAQSFMIPREDGESTDTQYCVTPRNLNALVSLETYDESGTNRQTYNAVWFKIRVRGDAGCTLPYIENQETLTRELSCVCNTMDWGRTGTALTGEFTYKTDKDFELCFIYASSPGLSVTDTNNNNKELTLTTDGSWSVAASCVKSKDGKANFVLKSRYEYNVVKLTFKAFPEEEINTIDPQGSSPAENLKYSSVPVILAIFSAVLFYLLES